VCKPQFAHPGWRWILPVCSCLGALASIGPLEVRGQIAPLVPEKPDQSQAIRPGEAFTVEIPESGEREFTVSACGGRFIQVRIEQLKWMINATVTEPMVAALPRASDAGLHSTVFIPFIAPQMADYRLTVRAAKGSSAAVRILLEPPRAAVAADTDRVAAYSTFARAEMLRRSTAPESAPKAIAAYDDAIGLAQGTADTSLQKQSLVGKTRAYLYRTGDYLARKDCACSNVRATPLSLPTPEGLANYKFTMFQGSHMSADGTFAEISAHAAVSIPNTGSISKSYISRISTRKVVGDNFAQSFIDHRGVCSAP